MAFRSSSYTPIKDLAIGGTLPTGTQIGDRLYAFIIRDQGSQNRNFLPADASWKLVGNSIQASPDGQTCQLFELIYYTGSENMMFYSDAVLNDVNLYIVALSGRHTTALAVISTTTKTSSNTTPISASYTGVTAASGDDIVLLGYLDLLVYSDTWSFSTVSGYTMQQNNSNWSWIAATVQNLDNASAGATGNLATTVTRTAGTGNAGYGGYVIAVPKADTVFSSPTIPSKQSAREGTAITFSVSATGTGSLSYQWQKKTNGGNWENISGATSSSYTVYSLKREDK